MLSFYLPTSFYVVYFQMSVYLNKLGSSKYKLLTHYLANNIFSQHSFQMSGMYHLTLQQLKLDQLHRRPIGHQSWKQRLVYCAATLTQGTVYKAAVV